MKEVLLEQEIRRIFKLMDHGKTNEVNESLISENVGENAFGGYGKCVTIFPIKKGSLGTIQNKTAEVQQYGVYFADPVGIKQLEGVSFANTGEVFTYGRKRGDFSCQGNTIVYYIDGKRNTYTPAENKPKVLPDVVITAPPKFLKNTQGVKDFQDWLDINKKGWLKGGQLNKKGGYGTYGPNTQKAWAKHKDEYMKHKSQSSTTTSSVGVQSSTPNQQTATQSSTPNQQTATQSSGNLMQHKIYNPENEQ